jgi:hypothetical protein
MPATISKYIGEPVGIKVTVTNKSLYSVGIEIGVALTQNGTIKGTPQGSSVMLEGGKSYTLDVLYGTSGFTEGTYNLYVWVNDARTGKKIADKMFTGVVNLYAPVQIEIVGYDLY